MITKKKTLWLLGVFCDPRKNFNLFLQVLVGTVHFYVWECKIKRCKLSWSGCDSFCKEKIGNMLKISSKLVISKRVLHISFFRERRDEQ
jgi:hypothetical protein